MDWFIGKTGSLVEVRENHKNVMDELLSRECKSGTFQIYTVFEHFKIIRNCNTYYFVYPQSDGSKFRRLCYHIRNVVFGDTYSKQIKNNIKDPNYTTRVDNLVELAKLEVEKIVIQKSIEELQYEISVLKLDEDKINNRIDELEKSIPNIPNITNQYTKYITVPHEYFPIISFPCREYNAHGYDIVKWGTPKINPNFLAFFCSVFIYNLLN